MQIDELKDRYRIQQAWRDLGLPGKPGKICRSPFPALHKHGDANPSGSVFADGKRWHDFTMGGGGDVFDLVAKAHGCDIAQAIRFVEERVGVTRSERPRNVLPQPKSKVPPLRRGTNAELPELSERRGFSIDALGQAEERGFLHFCMVWAYPGWCITDKRRELYEFRRLDGEMWPAYGRLPERKSHCIGSGKNWPIGTIESEPFQKIAWVEGAPDFLSAFHFLVLEGKEKTVAPVAVLGASNHHLAQEALAHFKGKSVCLYPHLDTAGRQASRTWAQQLKDAGVARVTAFDLSGLVMVDGTEGKDLADVCRMSADCWETARKFHEVLP